MSNISLPIPTVDLVREECRDFDRRYQLVEETLGLLWAQYPSNVETSHVLLKVLVLNKLYSTQVRDIDVEPLARHIVDLGVDSLFAQGSLGAVDLITNCPGLRKYPSFASKFCSWHLPTVYPIWDSYARAALRAYKKQDEFSQFHSDDLWSYQSFHTIVAAFQSHYGLGSLTFKEVDKFLWRAGDRILNGGTELPI